MRPPQVGRCLRCHLAQLIKPADPLLCKRCGRRLDVIYPPPAVQPAEPHTPKETPLGERPMLRLKCTRCPETIIVDLEQEPHYEPTCPRCGESMLPVEVFKPREGQAP